MEKINLFACFFAVSLIFMNCKNENSSNTNKAATTSEAVTKPAAEATTLDTSFGIQGAESPNIKQIDATTKEFTYQKYVVRVSPSAIGAGEDIMVTNRASGDPYLIANGNAYHFNGLYGKYLFVDDGTGPNVRQLIIFDLEKRRADHQAQVSEISFIDVTGKLWYYKTVPAETIEKLPECPEKATWEQQGLTVTYGKRELFLTNSGAIVGKPEFKCFAGQ